MDNPDLELTDSAKRMSDDFNMHVLAGTFGKWIATRLSDGGSNHIAYDTFQEARKDNPEFPEYFCINMIPPDGMNTSEAKAVLSYWRALYSKGFRQPDPDSVMPPLMPLTKRDQREQIKILTK